MNGVYYNQSHPETSLNSYNESEIYDSNEPPCVICGQPSNGYHFRVQVGYPLFEVIFCV